MTGDVIYHVLCGILVLGVLFGIAMMSRVDTAARGNMLSATCVAAAVVLTLVHYDIIAMARLWIVVCIGLIAGLYWSSRIRMIDMPQVVALLNGFGGAASALVAIMVLRTGQRPPAFTTVTAGLALVVGMVTLTGSLVAAGKLHKLLSQRPVIWKLHRGITTFLLFVSVAAMILMAAQPSPAGWAIVLCAVASALFGYAFAIRVGGADMPITISLLNSLSGVAGAIAGMAIGDQLLVAIGGVVGASGLLLTQIMCRAMNRHLFDILLGKTAGAAIGAATETAKIKESVSSPTSPSVSVAELLASAKRVIIVPGYGMAIAQAQRQVAQLANMLEGNGARVDFAIHPVAGRMPGHMNVLLAEANVSYEKMREMDDINGDFVDCDLAIVVGANDVVNPSANTAEGTPIYGMPVLDVARAKHIVICNFDRSAGYAGVDNPMYDWDNVLFMPGDAADTVQELLSIAAMEDSSTTAPASCDWKSLLGDAKRVIIVPGYGMAIAQAQRQVAQLAKRLESNGAIVDFAIHPVAGRMPGHMNVLLAEANVPYEKMREMDDINGEFADCDLAIVVGANDVVNPSANTAEGTPIYGMPVLDVDKAKHIVICNYDRAPGYAGVENPLFDRKNALLLMGDAADTVQSIIAGIPS